MFITITELLPQVFTDQHVYEAKSLHGCLNPHFCLTTAFVIMQPNIH